MPVLSINSGVQREAHCPSRKAKRGPLNVYQSRLRLLLGTGAFKGEIPVPMCIRIKLQQLQQQDPTASLDEMVQTATNTFSMQRKGEGGQGPGKGEKKRAKACIDAGHPPVKPYGKLQVLEGQGMRQMPVL